MSIHEIKAANYSVYVGNAGFAILQKMLTKKEYADARKVIVVDEHTHDSCLPQLVSNVEALHSCEIMEIESGEQNKNLEVCYGLWSTLSEMQADRNTVIINLGGGVIGDMGGFVASTYKRGIRFIQIPTTLLAQVDASIGGKLGVDLDGQKNLVGVFNNPEAVFVIPEFLRTLGKDQVISGMGEVIKHALVRDPQYWNQVLNTDLSSMDGIEALLLRSVEIKNGIVLEDPTEKGPRKLLNFGHTVGHAIETYSLESSTRSLLHGEAIAVGMLCECFMSFQKGWLTEDELAEIRDYIMGLFKPYDFDDMAYHRLIELMKNDKKNQNGVINFTMLKGIGNGVHDQTAHSDQIISALDYYRDLVKDKVA
jgi:3-dehydroquinate synthase